MNYLKLFFSKTPNHSTDYNYNSSFLTMKNCQIDDDLKPLLTLTICFCFIKNVIH